MNSLKRDLSIDTTLDLRVFSMDTTFKDERDRRVTSARNVSLKKSLNRNLRKHRDHDLTKSSNSRRMTIIFGL